jgi:hypothetical protein
MKPDFTDAPAPIYHHLFVRPAGSGGYTAGVLGLPEVRATGATEPQALQAVLKSLEEWLTTTRWVQVRVPQTGPGPPVTQHAGFVDPTDPDQQEYLELLKKMREEDRERTLREYQEECSGSSSTPTT